MGSVIALRIIREEEKRDFILFASLPSRTFPREIYAQSKTAR